MLRRDGGEGGEIKTERGNKRKRTREEMEKTASMSQIWLTPPPEPPL